MQVYCPHGEAESQQLIGSRSVWFSESLLLRDCAIDGPWGSYLTTGPDPSEAHHMLRAELGETEDSPYLPFPISLKNNHLGSINLIQNLS